MKAAGIIAGMLLTAILMWFVLGGVNVWRHAAFPAAPAASSARPDGGVRVQFYRAPRPAGDAAP